MNLLKNIKASFIIFVSLFVASMMLSGNGSAETTPRGYGPVVAMRMLQDLYTKQLQLPGLEEAALIDISDLSGAWTYLGAESRAVEGQEKSVPLTSFTITNLEKEYWYEIDPDESRDGVVFTEGKMLRPVSRMAGVDAGHNRVEKNVYAYREDEALGGSSRRVRRSATRDPIQVFDLEKPSHLLYACLAFSVDGKTVILICRSDDGDAQPHEIGARFIAYRKLSFTPAVLHEKAAEGVKKAKQFEELFRTGRSPLVPRDPNE